MAGVYTRCVSTNYGASDDRAIKISTICVRDDCEVSILKDRTDAGAAWKM